MEVRKYQREDSTVICSWLKDEKSFYQWSAGRLGAFPPAGDALQQAYDRMEQGRLFPLSAVDEHGNLAGHVLLRYPDGPQEDTVRFGYIIVNPLLRGQGNGKRMLGMAIGYAEDVLGASRVTLGVFANNESARRCYESLGFRPSGERVSYQMPLGSWECIEMERKRRPADGGKAG